MNTTKKKGGLSRKITLLCLLMSVVVCAGACIVGNITYRSSTFRTYNDFAYQVAEVVISCVDGSRVAGYLDVESGQEDQAYEDMVISIYTMFDSMELTSIYLCVPDPETLTVTTIFDVREIDADDPSIYERGVVDPIGSNPQEVVKVFQTGERSSDYFVRENSFGYNTSAILPVKDDEGRTTALLVVDVPMPYIVGNLNHYLALTIGVTVLLTCLVMFLNMAYLRRRVVRPIGLLTGNAQEFAENRSGFGHDLLQVRTGDEIETLARALGQMEADIVTYIDNLAAVTAEKERIGAELNVATQIQASMLPSIFPAFPERPEFDIYATMQPAKEVGGDFYDFFLVDSDHLALVMADVSGKGVPAALFMVIAKTLLKNAAQMGLSPKEALSKVNDQLCENNEAEMFVTVWLGILEVSTGRLTCANAGHEYPALRRAGGEYELVKDEHGFVLAGMEGVRYREYELELASGDELYVYTDGVAEATNADEVLFGTDRMLEALNSHLGAGPDILLPKVKEVIDSFVGNAPQFDDITMLGLRYLGPQKEEVG